MNIEKINGWLTLFANIGVLLGIIFLALELEQNTDIARSASYGETIQELNDWRSLVASDPELSSIFQHYILGNTESLDQVQDIRLRQLVSIILSIYENAYFSYDRGILGETEWQRHERRACEHIGIMERNTMNLRAVLTEEFSSYLENNCS